MDSPLATASMGAVVARSAAKEGVVTFSPPSSTTGVAFAGVITGRGAPSSGRPALPEGGEARGGAAARQRPPGGLQPGSTAHPLQRERRLAVVSWPGPQRPQRAR